GAPSPPRRRNLRGARRAGTGARPPTGRSPGSLLSREHWRRPPAAWSKPSFQSVLSVLETIHVGIVGIVQRHQRLGVFRGRQRIGLRHKLGVVRVVEHHLRLKVGNRRLAWPKPRPLVTFAHLVTPLRAAPLSPARVSLPRS